MATAIAPKIENPKNPTDLNLPPPSTDNASSTHKPLSPGECGDESKAESKNKPAAEKTGGLVTDVQKKMKRAERFGTPVHLSEEEKRNSRAERFGTASALNGLDSSKQDEELKRKARAERFGVVKSTPADEEVKKKARLSRFGSSTDSAEEDKKKARALRFAHPDSSSKANGEGKIEKTTIAGKAGGGT